MWITEVWIIRELQNFTLDRERTVITSELTNVQCLVRLNGHFDRSFMLRSERLRIHGLEKETGKQVKQ